MKCTLIMTFYYDDDNHRTYIVERIPIPLSSIPILNLKSDSFGGVFFS